MAGVAGWVSPGGVSPVPGQALPPATAPLRNARRHGLGRRDLAKRISFALLLQMQWPARGGHARAAGLDATSTGTTLAQALKPCVSATGTGYVPARTRTFRAQGQSFGFVCRHARGAPGRCLRHLACSWAGRSHANPRHCEWLLAGEVRLGLSIIRGGLQIRLTRNRGARDRGHRWQAVRFSR